MTELEKIEYAKTFIDKLANGVNPLDDTPIPDGEVVNHVRLSRCFFYVSDILRQVIENGGVTPLPKAPKAGKQAFTITEEARANLRVSETPLTVSEIADYLNSTVDETIMKKISAASINSWMLDRGFLEVVERPDGKTRKLPTPEGRDLGIFVEERMGQYGPYTVVKYSASAQSFVYDHVEAIVELNEQEKAAKKEQKAAAKAQKTAASLTPSYQPPITEFLNRPWTDVHDDRLRRMAADGATVAEMAEAIKRTEAGITDRLRYLNLI